jgi:hypothetical protein
MQLAHWISRTEIAWLAHAVPPWISMWFAVFPTYETIMAQLFAAVLVVGSYCAARGWHTGPGMQTESATTVQAPANAAVVASLETVR